MVKSELSAQSITAQMVELGNPKLAAHHRRFFKTAPGQYGAGDCFLGLSVPQVRQLCSQYRDMVADEIEKMLDSPWHEVRLAAALLLTEQFKRAKLDQDRRAQIIALYLRRVESLNNWDLIDLSAGMLGIWLQDKDRAILYELASSDNLWRRRLALVANLPLIKSGDFGDILPICTQMLSTREDLLHKAMGWMLREVGKRDIEVLRDFLATHHDRLPRTTLRYAIEKMEPSERERWMHYKGR